MVGISKILTNVLVFRLIQDSSLTHDMFDLTLEAFLNAKKPLRYLCR
jgi:hypothetical protein